MKILFFGLNYAPEEIGIGKYSGEMIQGLSEAGHQCKVVTAPPYYPQWKVQGEYQAGGYQRDLIDPEKKGPHVEVIRCPLWVPKKPSGLKRILHLASFGLSGAPAVLWKAMRFRPDVIMTVEPAAFCMPTTWLVSRLFGAKAWLHIQDFEVEAAFGLGLIKSPRFQKLILKIEAMMMRRFDRVSSISPNMLKRLDEKGVPRKRLCSLPNWVDCDKMRPLDEGMDRDHADEYRRKLRRRFGIPANSFVALYAGNIGVKQGLEIIIKAAKQMKNSAGMPLLRNRVHFVICGNGAAQEDLKKKLAEGVDGVQMLPVQPFEQFNDLMNCADVHLLPQRAGVADLVMPSKLTGMLATGRPVIACAAENTQISDVVSGCGLTVPPGDTTRFIEAVTRLAEDTELRQSMEKEARRYAIENLSQDACLKHLMQELDVLTGRRKIVVRTVRRWGYNFANYLTPESSWEKVR